MTSDIEISITLFLTPLIEKFEPIKTEKTTPCSFCEENFSKFFVFNTQSTQTFLCNGCYKKCGGAKKLASNSQVEIIRNLDAISDTLKNYYKEQHVPPTPYKWNSDPEWEKKTKEWLAGLKESEKHM